MKHPKINIITNVRKYIDFTIIHSALLVCLTYSRFFIERSLFMYFSKSPVTPTSAFSFV